MKSKTVVAKYIFLDIVRYSYQRTVEAQTDIIAVMNKIVLTTIKSFKIKTSQRILIPTGDGICIALLDMNEPYDVHLQIALSILQELAKYNKTQSDSMRQFLVRIGLNENTDNLVIDVNDNTNIAGAGITEAQRIMDQGSGGTVFVGRTVYAQLHLRERHLGKFRHLPTTIKHNIRLDIYQYVDPTLSYLNSEDPRTFNKLISKVKSKKRSIKEKLFS